MVSFIMANYNGEQIIAETIDGVLNLNFDHNKLQLIIVDDCSTDQSINLIKSQYANHLGKLIHLIENKQNQGVAKSYNTGIQAALDNSESEYIFKIDNDLVMHADVLNELLKVFERDKDIMIAGGKVLYYNKRDKIQAVGNNLSRRLGLFPFFRIVGKNADRNTFNDPLQIDIVNGSMMLFKREVFEQFGLFLNIYGKYAFEDWDFQLLIKKKYKTFYWPDAIGFHRVSYTSEQDKNLSVERLFLASKNILILMSRFNSRLQFSCFVPYLFLRIIAESILRKRSLSPLLKGYVAGIRYVLKTNDKVSQ